MSEHTANPNSSPGAGYGTPIRKDDDVDKEMKDFMRRVGDYQDQRNLAASSANKAGGIKSQYNRTTSFPPASLPSQPKRHDPRKHLENNGKPFAFALGKGEGGATCWWGMLIAYITIINCTRYDGKITSITQPPITRPEPYAASNLENEPNKPTELGWWGNVYAYWEADDAGSISAFEIKGPDAPEGQDIGELEADLTREVTSGKFYIKIGTVPEEGDIDQQISSDIPWFIPIVRGGSTPGSDASNGSDPSTPSDGSSAIGSSKDHAIVPGPNGTYVKWHAMESAEVLFFDFQEFKVKHGTTRIAIDPVVLFGIERPTARAFGSPDVGNAHVTVEGDEIVIRSRFSKRIERQTVQVMLKATRRGFAGVRNGHATFDDMVDNECRLNPRMTREQVLEALSSKEINQ